MTSNLPTTPSCPVCSDPVSHSSSTSCPLCGVPHHKDCWGYNEGCGIFGCGSDKKKALVPRTQSSNSALESRLDNLPATQEQPASYLSRAIQTAKTIANLPKIFADWHNQNPVGITKELITHFIATPAALALSVIESLYGDKDFQVYEAGQPVNDNDSPSRWVIRGVHIPDQKGEFKPHEVHLCRINPGCFIQFYHPASFPEIAGIACALSRNALNLMANTSRIDVTQSLQTLFQPREVYHWESDGSFKSKGKTSFNFLEADAKGVFDSSGKLKAVVHHPNERYAFQYNVQSLDTPAGLFQALFGLEKDSLDGKELSEHLCFTFGAESLVLVPPHAKQGQWPLGISPIKYRGEDVLAIRPLEGKSDRLTQTRLLLQLDPKLVHGHKLDYRDLDSYEWREVQGHSYWGPTQYTPVLKR